MTMMMMEEPKGCKRVCLIRTYSCVVVWGAWCAVVVPLEGVLGALMMFNGEDCNTNAEFASNWANTRSPLTAANIATPAVDAPATVAVGYGGSNPLVPVDILFRGDYTFGEIELDDGASVSFGDGAKWNVNDEASGDTARFIGGQVPNPKCVLGCHENWLELPYVFGQEIKLEQGVPTFSVPCTFDTAYFPPEYHMSLDVRGTHMYDAINVNGLAGVNNTLPTRQMAQWGDSVSFIISQNANAQCTNNRGMSPRCTCPSTCRNELDPVLLEDLNSVRAGAQTVAASRISNLGPPAASADSVLPTVIAGVSNRRTLRIGKNLPQADLELFVNSNNKGPLAAHIIAGVLSPRTALIAVQKLDLEQSLRISRRHPGRYSDTGFATHLIEAVLVHEPANLTAFQWEQVEQLVEDLVGTYNPITAPCFTLQSDIDHDCLVREMEIEARILQRRGLVSFAIQNRLQQSYADIRGCSVYELCTDTCEEAARSPDRVQEAQDLATAAIAAISTTTGPNITVTPKIQLVDQGNTDEPIGYGVLIGVPIALLAIAGIVFFIVIRRRNEDERRARGLRVGASFANPLYDKPGTYLKATGKYLDASAAPQRKLSRDTYMVDMEDDPDDLAEMYGELAAVVEGDELYVEPAPTKAQYDMAATGPSYDVATQKSGALTTPVDTSANYYMATTEVGDGTYDVASAAPVYTRASKGQAKEANKSRKSSRVSGPSPLAPDNAPEIPSTIGEYLETTDAPNHEYLETLGTNDDEVLETGDSRHSQGFAEDDDGLFLYDNTTGGSVDNDPGIFGGDSHDSDEEM